jgi:hypothetical protein
MVRVEIDDRNERSDIESESRDEKIPYGYTRRKGKNSIQFLFVNIKTILVLSI